MRKQEAATELGAENSDCKSTEMMNEETDCGASHEDSNCNSVGIVRKKLVGQFSDDGASKGQLDFNVAAGSLPENVTLKPKLDRIFADVESSLPAIDFDLSDVSSEDDMPIFTRTLKTPPFDVNVPDVDQVYLEIDAVDMTKDLDVRPRDSSPRSLLLPVDHHAFDGSSALLCAAQRMLIELDRPAEGFLSCVNELSALRTMSTCNGVSSSCLPSTKSIGNCSIDGNRKPLPPAGMKTKCKSSGNETKTSCREPNLKERSRNVVSMYIPDMPLKLFNDDSIDSALSNDHGKWDDAPLEIGYDRHRDKPVTDQKVVVHHEEMSLLERLAQFSMHQSGAECLKDFDPRTGALSNKAVSSQAITKEQPTQKTSSTLVKSTSTGTTTADLAGSILPRRTPPTTRRRNQDHGTVFIDLRHHDDRQLEQQRSVEKVQKVLGLSIDVLSSSSDESDSADNSELWFEQRRRIKQCLQSGKPVDPEVTKKKSSTPTRVVTHSKTRVQRLAGHLPASVKSKGLKISLLSTGDSSSLMEVSKSTPEVVEPTKRQHATLSTTSAAPSTNPLSPITQNSRTSLGSGDCLANEKHKVQDSHKAQDRRTDERKSRIRIGESLESLRPATSLKGKQSCADGTPVVFDIDVSYEPESKPLPVEFSSYSECSLLIVQLSSCGHIAGNTGGSKSIDQGVKVSASYVALISWFLSHVKSSEGDSEAESSVNAQLVDSAPFRVIGLEQMVFEGQLGLYVAIVPVRQFTVKDLPPKAKKDTSKELSPFHKIVTKYLATNTLFSVCPWLADIIPQDVHGPRRLPTQCPTDSLSSPSSSHRQPFVYRPSLFSITTRPLSTFVQLNTDPRAVQRHFLAPIGFFWMTVETADEGPVGETETSTDIQTTMSLVYKQVFFDPRATMAILTRVLQDGLSLCGLRLLYPTGEQMDIGGSTVYAAGMSEVCRTVRTDNGTGKSVVGPVLAVALRGAGARTVWLDAVGPSDPVLARRTDPLSLCALYGGESRDSCLIFCPRNPYRTVSEIVRWFGGRVPASGVLCVGEPPSTSVRPSSGGKTKKLAGSAGKLATAIENTTASKPVSTLTAMTQSDIFLTVSPLVPSRCLGLVLCICQRRGYRLRGVRRMHLSHRRATHLGITGSDELESFTLCSDSIDCDSTRRRQAYSPHGRPATVLLLSREDARGNASSLVEALTIQLVLLGVLGEIQEHWRDTLTSDHLFHFAPYSGALQLALGGDFDKVHSSDAFLQSTDISFPLYSNPELEQIVVLVICGRQSATKSGSFLANLLGITPYSRKVPLLPDGSVTVVSGFETLGMKWVPRIGATAAKDLTPYEVGDRSWKSSVRTLTSEPALVVVLRGVDAFARLEALILPTYGPSSPRNLEHIISPTPQLAFRLIAIFFGDHELFADDDARPLLPYLPPTTLTAQPLDIGADLTTRPSSGKGRRSRVKPVVVDGETVMRESIFDTMLCGPRPLTTVLIIRPDVVRRNFSAVLRRVVQEGFHVIGLRLETLSEATVQQLLLPDYLVQPQCCMLITLLRENAVKRLVDIINSSDAVEDGLWRAVFDREQVSKYLHCSKTYVSAIAEMKRLFPDGLCCSGIADLMAEQIPCPAYDSEIYSHGGTIRELRVSRQLVNETSEGRSVATISPNMTRLQTTCILLTPSLFHSSTGRGRTTPYVDVIDHLTRAGFELVGCRMIWLTVEQSERFVARYKGSQDMVALLTSGPSIVLALQKDSAILAFDSYLGSDYDKQSFIARYGGDILRPADVNKASWMLTFFFSELSPSSCVEITTLSPAEP